VTVRSGHTWRSDHGSPATPGKGAGHEANGDNVQFLFPRPHDRLPLRPVPVKEATTSDGFCCRPEVRNQIRSIMANEPVAQGALVMSSYGPWQVPWHQLQLGYLHDVYLALVRREIQPSAHWISEFVPRSATILLAEPVNGDLEFALAWDEESGWRVGYFVQGDERCPTLLRRQEYICGAVLPDPAEVADTVVNLLKRHLRRRWPWQNSRTFTWGSYPPSYRCYRDTEDGFDDLLRSHLPPDDPGLAFKA
jgi:hypothetical protein